jgi:hypothetical protein
MIRRLAYVNMPGVFIYSLYAKAVFSFTERRSA